MRFVWVANTILRYTRHMEYSSTPLDRKLGLVEGQTRLVVNAPSHYASLLNEPWEFAYVPTENSTYDFIHFFADNAAELKTSFPKLKALLPPTGILWISWPKKASGATTDLTENIVRDSGLQTSLVDVKVAAIDETWSGLKFVFRLTDR